MADKAKKNGEETPALAFKNKEEGQKALEAQKKVVEEAKAAFTDFGKKHKLNAVGKDYSDDPKNGKEWSTLKKAQSRAISQRKAIEEALKAFKEPKKDRQTIYVYPPEVVTGPDKKKFRAAQRAKKKSEAKGTAPKVAKTDTKVVKLDSKKPAPVAVKTADKKADSKNSKPSPAPIPTKKKKED